MIAFSGHSEYISKQIPHSVESSWKVGCCTASAAENDSCAGAVVVVGDPTSPSTFSLELTVPMFDCSRLLLLAEGKMRRLNCTTVIIQRLTNNSSCGASILTPNYNITVGAKILHRTIVL